jgi:hypothetical protein
MSVDQNVTRRARRVGLMAGAVALLLQIVAWAWLPVWLSSSNAAEGVGIVICTPDGLKTLASGNDGTPPGQATTKTDPAKAGAGCPLCPLVAGLALPPPVDPVMPADLARHGSGALPGERIAAGWFLSTLQARAPPAVG